MMMAGQGEWRELVTSTPADTTAGWAHCGVAIDESGGILTADAARPELVRIECDGRVTWRMEVPVVEPHDLVLDDERIWIADCGVKVARTSSGVYEGRAPSHPVRGQTLRISRDGRVLDRLPSPPALGDGPFSPTSIAVDSVSSGGDGTVWVADGYGQSLVHRYDRGGSHVGVIDGAEGAGRFDTPHGLLIDRRRDPARLLISDRGNGRICAYTMSGQFLETVGSGVLLRPCGMALSGDELLVADLDGCVWIFGPDDALLSRIGHPTADHPEGWPNRIEPDGSHVAPAHAPWAFTSPHDIAVGRDGTIAVCEWLIGGRLVAILPAD